MSKRPRKKKTLEDYIEIAQSNQKYCVTCQPFEAGECIWVRGVQYSMPDFLGELNIPERFQDQVARGLTCSTCGAELDITCDVGMPTEDELNEERLWNSWYDTYSPRFEEFAKHLESYPYLGLLHPLGTEIVKEIKTLSKEQLPSRRWYRARKVEDSRLLSTSDLYPPDPKIVAIPEGRYNHCDQQVFYLSDTKENAAREILGKSGGLTWVQEFELKDLSNIALLCKDFLDTDDISELLFGLAYTNVLARPVERAAGWKPEYFVPRFISDCLKHEGYMGILFRSPHHYGENLVLFEYKKDHISHIADPSLVTLSEEKTPENLFGQLPAVDF